MSKPSVITPQYDNIPEELRALKQWVVWKHWFHKKRKVWIKLPMSPITGDAASTTDSATWSSFDAALTAFEFEDEYDGLGFVFTEDDGLVGIDIDKCIDADVISDLAVDIVKQVPGFIERSPSGKGLHIITRADLPRAYKDDRIGLEMYAKARFFTITGVPL